MSPETIAELFIKAAETDRKLPDTARPKTLKAMSFGYVHTTAEMNGWFAEDKHAANWAWLDPEKLRNSRNDIGLWEVAMELIKLVSKPENRRALWAWASSKAGGMSIAKWSRTVENVHPETASRRAKSAITEIHRKLSGKADLHHENRSEPLLPSTAEIGHKSTTIRAWHDEDARPVALAFDTDIAGLDWAELQKAKRREREARRRQAA